MAPVDDDGRPYAALVPSPGTQQFRPDKTIKALRSHPRFEEAVRAALAGISESYDGNRLLNRVMNDRGRVIGSLIALYLHFCPASPGDGTGLTVRRFQTFCVERKLCSFGRARALLSLMCLSGYLVPAKNAPDRRQRPLIPTEHMIAVHRQRWARQFEAMALVMPEAREVLRVSGRPEFMAAFLRQLAEPFLDGFRLLRYAPDLSRLVESNAGLLVVTSLFLSAADSMTPEGAVVPVSISALAARFGVARAHVRRLLADADAAGLVRRVDGSMTVIVLPRLVDAVSDFFAALFALLGHSAVAAVAGADRDGR